MSLIINLSLSLIINLSLSLIINLSLSLILNMSLSLIINLSLIMIHHHHHHHHQQNQIHSHKSYAKITKNICPTSPTYASNHMPRYMFHNIHKSCTKDMPQTYAISFMICLNHVPKYVPQTYAISFMICLNHVPKYMPQRIYQNTPQTMCQISKILFKPCAKSMP
jgi:hypothetical protein